MERINAWISKNRDIVFVMAILAITTIIFVPLPTFIIDLFLIMSVTMSLMIIITVTYLNQPLQFSVFPSVLLIATTYRLALNIATTRLILGNPPTAQAPAGYVIQTFGNFVGGADPLIGFIIFIIITVIQFVVITKGSGRISEVAARFTLDAMPGKQMSIDADLNAGLITEQDAKTKRENIAKEADFYGAMDGASKFVRGDAIAGIIVTLINIAGGFVIGWLNYGLTIQESLYTYTILTIGDGLVSQIPALIISLSAGLLVTRSTGVTQLGEEFFGQMFGEKKSLLLTSAFLGFLVLTPLPKLPLLSAGGVLFMIYYQIKKVQESIKTKEQIEKQKEARKPEKVEGLLPIDPVEVEVGYALIKLVDPSQGGAVLEKITRIRKQIAVELGLVIPPIRVRDNIALEHNSAVVKIRGIKVSEIKLMPEMILAINPGTATGKIAGGIQTKDPTFGLDAYWIDSAQKDYAEENGYTTVDAATVLSTNISEVVKRHAPELLTREDVSNLVKNLKETHPALVDEIIGKTLDTGQLQKVLKSLLREGVSIRDLPLIIETLAGVAPKAKGDIEIMTEYARQALYRQVTEKHQADDGKIYAVTLEPQVEDLLKSSTQQTDQGAYINLPPATLRKISDSVSKVFMDAKSKYPQSVFLSQPQIRPQFKRLMERISSDIAVLSYNELDPSVTVEVVGSVKSD